jgi:hypothetical protein
MSRLLPRLLLRVLVALAVLTPPAASTIADTTIARPPAPSEELNTVLMHATFLIVGPSNKVPNAAATGTVFIIGVPHKDELKIASIVLVTAAHVLEDIAGDKATLLLRRKNDDGTYRPLPFELAIRDHGRPLYVIQSRLRQLRHLWITLFRHGCGFQDPPTRRESLSPMCRSKVAQLLISLRVVRPRSGRF